jgi:hypothetical protein
MAIFKTNKSVADDTIEIKPKSVVKKVEKKTESKCPYHEEHKRHCVDCEKV